MPKASEPARKETAATVPDLRDADGEPVKRLPDSPYPDLRVKNPPKPKEGVLDTNRDPGKPRSALPPELQKLVGVPRAPYRPGPPKE